MTDTTLVIRRFEVADTEAVIALWQEAFPEYGDTSRPQRDPRLSIANKLAMQPELFFVATLEAQLAGTVMAGYDGHRGWLYSLAVPLGLRRRGIGTRLVAHAEHALTALGCPKVNLQVLESKPDVRRFYEALGYGSDAVISLGKRLGALAPRVDVATQTAD
ncbi:GNAT family acetyltransferase [Paraburkholderia kururiensis]|uniref:GNAT family acetyltransferase n=1 Tax=Paraburkholderia kururiensis TaxID=984307 RepID=A0ABZ0WDY8_9BURK|nr:GNAT family acetyltransferase [Paraburkholderia kururiensis]WQD75571.1 GNAT family acetyltransferase [Paraburkholderia kururiensis]